MIDPRRVLVVPQWKGSGSAQARLVAGGADVLAGLFPGAARTVADIDAGPGDFAQGVRHLNVLAAARDAVVDIVREWGADGVVTVGGDCAIELGPIAQAVARHGDKLTVVWFDAHPDLNSPQTSPSGAFHGMVLRTLLGDGPAALVPPPEQRLHPGKLVLAGVRSWDPPEREFIADNAIRWVPVRQLQDPAALLAAVTATGADSVYLHVDVDVLDPVHVSGLLYPEPGGAHPQRLRAVLDALTERFTLAGLGITEYSPPPGTARPDPGLRALFAD
ncbi:arginase family protein [Nocardia crassostreae]|uniref:arginase family protein n=1 Tax=Nocardia crassostreae TaxID=53428 RepID=UPI001C3F7EA7|nr:arginase family protein [Nocardia crassostreae]